MTTVNKGHVIVVNKNDEWLGTMEKLRAHKEGVLHRALSVFVLNNSHELLIQQRATGKYHTAGLWSNTCCSHPIPDESTMAAAHRRLQEEMGFDCTLKEIFTLRYKAEVGVGMTEHEYDHVYLGHYDGVVHANPDEVSSYKYIHLDALEQWMADEPSQFTPWLHMIFPQFKTYAAVKQTVT